MAGTNALNEEEIGKKLDEIDQKLRYGNLEEAVAISRPLYAAASANPAVQMVMSNLSEIVNRANEVLAQLDDCHEKLNWEQIQGCKREIDVLYCNHKIKRVVFLKIAGRIERYNQITAEALDMTLANNWTKAEERVREAETMDRNGMRCRKLRMFYDQFKEMCSGKKTLNYDSQQTLRELFRKYDLYRFSEDSPVYVTWRIDK